MKVPGFSSLGGRLRKALKQLAPGLHIQWLYRKRLWLPKPWGIILSPNAVVSRAKKRISRFLPRRSKKPEELSRKKKIKAQLDIVCIALGVPGRRLRPRQLDALTAALKSANRHDDDRLLKRFYTTAMREALLECEFAEHLLSKTGRYSSEGPASGSAYITVVDARCLQDVNYLGRGVGAHAFTVLKELRSTAGPGEQIILLLDPNMLPVAPAVRSLADGVIFAAGSLDLSRVRYFLCLSPMTAPIGPMVKFLLADWIRCATVVYDFIPASFPDHYLRTRESRIAYQARFLALGSFDVFLPISTSVARELFRRLPGVQPDQVYATGVADPHEGADQSCGSRILETLPERFILAPTGGDARKNLLVVIAAEGINRRAGLTPRSIVVVGRISSEQKRSVRKFARRCGVSITDLFLLEGLPSADLSALYRRADVCVVPSFAEGFSLPVAEAVSRDTPVVASRIPVHRELIGEGAWLAAARSPIAFSAAIQETLRRRTETIAVQRRNLADFASGNGVGRRLAAGFGKLRAPLSRLAVVRPAGQAVSGIGGRRARIAIATPWPPQASGIADHSEFVAKALARRADVTILVNTAPAGASAIPTRPISAAAYLDPSYDRVVTVLGNSHFHLPALEYVISLGGPIIGHDNRMFELYWYMRDLDWVARLLSRPGSLVQPDRVEGYLANLSDLPNLGYWEIAKVAQPLILHSSSMARRIVAETDVTPVVFPFIPYRLPDINQISQHEVAAARMRRGLEDGVIHIATFGVVDARTKGADILIEMAAWFKTWRQPIFLHFVGKVLDVHRQQLERQAMLAGVEHLVVFHDHAEPAYYKDMLLGVDVAIQLRTSATLTLSGALMDCVAFGVPTVTTETMRAEIEAPAFIYDIPDKLSPLLIAETALRLASVRQRQWPEIECQRQAYLQTRSGDAYAELLLRHLGLDADGWN